MGWSVERTSFDVMGKEEGFAQLKTWQSFAFLSLVTNCLCIVNSSIQTLFP
jgi:hypothetical protein